MSCVGCKDCSEINNRDVKITSGIAKWVKLHPCDISSLASITFNDQRLHRVVLTGVLLIWNLSDIANVSSVTINVINVTQPNAPFLSDSTNTISLLYQGETLTWTADAGKLLVGPLSVNIVNGNNIVSIICVERV